MGVRLTRLRVEAETGFSDTRGARVVLGTRAIFRHVANFATSEAFSFLAQLFTQFRGEPRKGFCEIDVHSIWVTSWRVGSIGRLATKGLVLKWVGPKGVTNLEGFFKTVINSDG